MLGVLERPVQLLDERDRLQVVEVHLPVAGDQRGATARSAASCSLPSEDLQSGKLLALEELEAGAAARRDVTEGVVVEPELADRRGGVSAADDRRPSTSVSACATALVPAANGASSNTPMGPFQNTVFGCADEVGESRRRVGTDVESQTGCPERGVLDLIGRASPRAPRRRRTSRPPPRRSAARVRRPTPRHGACTRGPCRAGRPRAGSSRPCGPGRRGT